MKKLTKTVIQAVTGIAAAITLYAGKAMALTVQEGAEAARGTGMPANLFGKTGVFSRITDTLLFGVGIISVVMLVYGGLRYIISGGDNKKVTDAKNTVLYAIIGLIIAFLSYAIVHFVIDAVSGGNAKFNY